VTDAQARSDSRFAGHVALVTGAASGIGRATAILLARQGAAVVVTDLDEQEVAGTVEAITTAGGIVVGLALDVTSESDWDRAVELVERRWGRLHILVNCAGIALVRAVSDTTLADWRRVLAVNLDGVFLGTRAGVRSMTRSGGGSIVNVASASGIRAAPASSAYCASKAAVIMLTKSVAMECCRDGSGVRVNAVAPGGVKTPMWGKTAGASSVVETAEWNAPADAPIGQRFADPDEVAQAILFLASAEASYITGTVLAVDAGYTA
jgi:NAD(P)-dependent dehydrogenase (short-subunit alcohol dehydrogenase family)